MRFDCAFGGPLFILISTKSSIFSIRLCINFPGFLGFSIMIKRCFSFQNTKIELYSNAAVFYKACFDKEHKCWNHIKMVQTLACQAHKNKVIAAYAHLPERSPCKMCYIRQKKRMKFQV